MKKKKFGEKTKRFQSYYTYINCNEVDKVLIHQTIKILRNCIQWNCYTLVQKFRFKKIHNEKPFFSLKDPTSCMATKVILLTSTIHYYAS